MSYNAPCALLIMRHSMYPIAFSHSRIPTVNLVSDPPTWLSTSRIGLDCAVFYVPSNTV